MYAHCEQCPLRGRPLVPGYGPPPDEAKAVIVGEAPGYTEAGEGRPFVGQAGKLLRSALEHVQLSPDDVYMTNVVVCHPPRNRLPPKAIECCRPRLLEELRQFKPPFVAVGAVATRALLRRFTSMTKMRGHWYRGGRVLVTWHSAYVLRNPSALHEFLIDMQKLARGKPQPVVEVGHYIVQTPADLHAWVTKMINDYAGETLCYDLETDQVDWENDEVLCMAVAYTPTDAFVIPRELLKHPEARVALERLFDSTLRFVGHNVKFDIRFLRHQLGVCNARAEFDSMLAQYVLKETGGLRSRGLKKLLLDYFDIEDYEQDLVQVYLKNKNDRYSKVPAASLMCYNALDVCYNLRLWELLKSKLVEESLFDQPFMHPLMDAYEAALSMELRGFSVDMEALTVVSMEMEEAMEGTHAGLERICGKQFNPRSPKQVAPIMFEHYGMPKVSGRNYKQGSTCADAREKILPKLDPEGEAYHWLRLFGRYRSLVKIRSTYVVGVLNRLHRDGKAHTDFNLGGAETGRLSVSSPPLHSIPHPGRARPGEADWGDKVRGCFVTQPGWLIMQVDFSQAEMRVAAGYSGDQFLLESYRAGKDLHNETAKALYGEDYTARQRQICKNWNFSQIYGGTIHSFAAEAGMRMDLAREFSRRYQEFMSGLNEWRGTQLSTMHEQGYVETVFGRRRRFSLITEANLSEVRKACVNAPIQGTASDLTLSALIRVHRELESSKLPAHLLLSVHDSIILEVRRDAIDKVATLVSKLMVETAGKHFPMLPWKVDVEVGDSWGRLSPWSAI